MSYRTLGTVALTVGLGLTAAAMAQMSPEEAQQRMEDRAAERSSAATQPDVASGEVSDLKEIVTSLRAENERLKRQLEELQMIVPEVPQVGWTLERIRRKACNRIKDDLVFFNVEADGTLQGADAGRRQTFTRAGSGQIQLSGTDANGNHLTGRTPSIPLKYTLPQLHEYKVTVNNGSADEKAAFDTFVVLVNVDTGKIDRVGAAGGTQIARGMSKEKVLAILGIPDSDTNDADGQEHMHWDFLNRAPPPNQPLYANHSILADFRSDVLFDFSDTKEN